MPKALAKTAGAEDSQDQPDLHIKLDLSPIHGTEYDDIDIDIEDGEVIKLGSHDEHPVKIEAVSSIAPEASTSVANPDIFIVSAVGGVTPGSLIPAELQAGHSPAIDNTAERLAHEVKARVQEVEEAKKRLAGYQLQIKNLKVSTDRASELVEKGQQKFNETFQLSKQLREQSEEQLTQGLAIYERALRLKHGKDEIERKTANVLKEIEHAKRSLKQKEEEADQLITQVDQLRQEVAVQEGLKRTLNRDLSKLQENVSLSRARISMDVSRFNLYNAAGRASLKVSESFIALADENARLYRFLTKSQKMRMPKLHFPLTSTVPFPYCVDHPQYRGQPSFDARPECPQATCRSPNVSDFLSPTVMSWFQRDRYVPKHLHVELPVGVETPEELHIVKITTAQPEKQGEKKPEVAEAAEVENNDDDVVEIPAPKRPKRVYNTRATSSSKASPPQP